VPLVPATRRPSPVCLATVRLVRWVVPPEGQARMPMPSPSATTESVSWMVVPVEARSSTWSPFGRCTRFRRTWWRRATMRPLPAPVLSLTVAQAPAEAESVRLSKTTMSSTAAVPVPCTWRSRAAASVKAGPRTSLSRKSVVSTSARPARTVRLAPPPTADPLEATTALLRKWLPTIFRRAVGPSTFPQSPPPSASVPVRRLANTVQASIWTSALSRTETRKPPPVGAPRLGEWPPVTLRPTRERVPLRTRTLTTGARPLPSTVVSPVRERKPGPQPPLITSRPARVSPTLKRSRRVPAATLIRLSPPAARAALTAAWMVAWVPPVPTR
jgi:hypothetical protein